MDDDLELTWRLYQEHCNWERHHEAQRASATNLLLAISAGILGVITYDGLIGFSDLPLTLFLVLQGIFGAFFVEKQYERFAMHQRRASKYREQLDALAPTVRLLQLREESDSENTDRYPRLSNMKLHRFWASLHLLIAVIGCVLAIVILWNLAI